MLHWSWIQKRATDSWPLVCVRPSAPRLCTGFYRPGGLYDYHCPDSNTPRGDEKVSSLIVSLSSTFLSSVVSTDTGLGWRHADGQAPHLPGDPKPRAMARPPAHISHSYVSSHFCLIMNLPFVQGKVFVLFHSEQLSEVSNLPNWHFTKFCALREWRSWWIVLTKENIRSTPTALAMKRLSLCLPIHPFHKVASLRTVWCEYKESPPNDMNAVY